MTAWNYKTLIIFGVFALILYVWVSDSQTFAVENPNQRILELRGQIAELERQAQEYKNKISATQKQSQTLQREITILSSQISRLQTELLITERKIFGTEIEIRGLEGEIFGVAENIEEKQYTISRIISLINSQDNENLLVILLKNEKISDFFDKIKQSQNAQKQLLAAVISLKNIKNDLELKKTELDNKKLELEGLNQSQKSQIIALDGSKYNKDAILKQTKGKETEYQKILSGVEQKRAEFFEELQKIEREAVKTGAYILRVSAPIPPKQKIFGWPEDDYILTQGYGMTSYAKRGAYGGAPHNGLDMASGFGTPIKAIGDGKILVSGTNDGWGNWVAVQHLNGLVSVYGHMRTPSGIENNEPVRRGDIIGFEGSTGNSTGSHVHLSLYHEFFTFINPRNGQIYFNYFDGTLNPVNYLI